MKTDDRVKKTVVKHGYEYTLIACESRKNFSIDDPCFMGNAGYALQSCKKRKG
jgi:hypothetical protein